MECCFRCCPAQLEHRQSGQCSLRSTYGTSSSSQAPTKNGRPERGTCKPIWKLLREAIPSVPSIYFCSPLRDMGFGKSEASGRIPSIRVLGYFIAKDVFVATNYALRGDLGGWDSREWRDAKVMAGTMWTRLFHQYRPLITTDINRLVSGALNGRYFKGG